MQHTQLGCSIIMSKILQSLGYRTVENSAPHCGNPEMCSSASHSGETRIQKHFVLSCIISSRSSTGGGPRQRWIRLWMAFSLTPSAVLERCMGRMRSWPTLEPTSEDIHHIHPQNDLNGHHLIPSWDMLLHDLLLIVDSITGDLHKLTLLRWL